METQGSDTEQSQGLAARALRTTVPRRVLVAEDDTVTREAIGDVLADDGDDVIAVADGAQLLECLETISRDSLRAPDLVLMDISMPGLSGLDVLAKMRADGWRTPVVLMTAFATLEAREQAREVGWAIVIEKPFTLDELHLAARFARWRAGSLIGPRGGA